jgi:hypothetical protein
MIAKTFTPFLGVEPFVIMGFPEMTAPGWGAGYWCEAAGCG